MWLYGLYLLLLGAGECLETEISMEAAFQGRCGRNSPCMQLCYELHDGMYECDCTEGYELDKNGYSCQELNSTNQLTDGTGKPDEDVLYQKGASFSAKLDSHNLKRTNILEDETGEIESDEMFSANMIGTDDDLTIINDKLKLIIPTKLSGIKSPVTSTNSLIKSTETLSSPLVQPQPTSPPTITSISQIQNTNNNNNNNNNYYISSSSSKEDMSIYDDVNNNRLNLRNTNQMFQEQTLYNNNNGGSGGGGFNGGGSSNGDNNNNGNNNNFKIQSSSDDGNESAIISAPTTTTNADSIAKITTTSTIFGATPTTIIPISSLLSTTNSGQTSESSKSYIQIDVYEQVAPSVGEEDDNLFVVTGGGNEGGGAGGDTSSYNYIPTMNNDGGEIDNVKITPTSITIKETTITMTNKNVMADSHNSFHTNFTVENSSLNKQQLCQLNCGTEGICDNSNDIERCLCPFGKTGLKCEENIKINTPRFTKRSWMAFPALRGAYKHVQLHIEFRPESFDGIILLTGERDDLTGDFMAVLIHQGFIEFWFDCGSGTGKIRSDETVQLNQWNSITVYRHRWDAWILLNEGGRVQGRSKGLFSRITFREPVFLGGTGNITGLARKLPVFDGMVGCIRKFIANEHEYQFATTPHGDITQGFDVQECTTDRCGTFPCRHGGKCIPSDQGAICLCPLGFGGDLCEMSLDLQVPAFNGSSYLSYVPIGDSSLIWFELKMVIKPQQEDGLLLYSGHHEYGDFISLCLNMGFIEFSFDLGSGAATVRSEFPVSMGRWHTIKISRTARLAVLKVDQLPEVMTISPNGFWHLSLPHSVYLGGVQNVQSLPPTVRERGSFVGCIQEVILNGRPLSIIAEALSGTNVDNCPHACVARPCGLLATCIPYLENYECRCNPSNAQCNQAEELSSLQITTTVEERISVPDRILTVNPDNDKIDSTTTVTATATTTIKTNTAAELFENNGLVLTLYENQDQDDNYYKISNDEPSVSETNNKTTSINVDKTNNSKKLNKKINNKNDDNNNDDDSDGDSVDDDDDDDDDVDEDNNDDDDDDEVDDGYNNDDSDNDDANDENNDEKKSNNNKIANNNDNDNDDDDDDKYYYYDDDDYYSDENDEMSTNENASPHFNRNNQNEPTTTTEKPLIKRTMTSTSFSSSPTTTKTINVKQPRRSKLFTSVKTMKQQNNGRHKSDLLIENNDKTYDDDNSDNNDDHTINNNKETNRNVDVNQMMITNGNGDDDDDDDNGGGGSDGSGVGIDVVKTGNSNDSGVNDDDYSVTRVFGRYMSVDNDKLRRIDKQQKQKLEQKQKNKMNILNNKNWKNRKIMKKPFSEEDIKKESTNMTTTTTTKTTTITAKKNSTSLIINNVTKAPEIDSTERVADIIEYGGNKNVYDDGVTIIKNSNRLRMIGGHNIADSSSSSSSNSRSSSSSSSSSISKNNNNYRRSNSRSGSSSSRSSSTGSIGGTMMGIGGGNSPDDVAHAVDDRPINLYSNEDVLTTKELIDDMERIMKTGNDIRSRASKHKTKNFKKGHGACFTGADSYFHYNDAETMRQIISYKIDLNLRFKTHSVNGLILWTGRHSAQEADDFLSLGIENGYLYLRYNLGSGEVNIQYNTTKVSDGLWHRIRAFRNRQEGSLEVDGGRTITQRSPGRLRQLNTDTGLYVGGMPDVLYYTRRRYMSGIVGCISEIVLAGELRLSLDPETLGTAHNVEPGIF